MQMEQGTRKPTVHPLKLLALAYGLTLPSAFGAAAWHAHEMIYGFVLAAIAGLEAAYATIFHGSGLSSEVTAALNLTARGSLAAWFSSVLLSMAAANAVLVYWLRSHKLDDYRGRSAK